MYKKFALITLLVSVVIAMAAKSLFPTAPKASPDATAQPTTSAAPPPAAPAMPPPETTEVENGMEASQPPVFGMPALDPKGIDPKPAITFADQPKPPPPTLPPSAMPLGQDGKPMISPHDRAPPPVFRVVPPPGAPAQ